MSSRYEEIARFWNYEAYNWSNEHNPLGNLREPVAEYVRQSMDELAAHIPPEGVILDLGSGSDSHLYYQSRASQRLISLEVSHQMLLYNKGSYKVEADLEYQLPIATNSIDACMSVMLMRYLKCSEQIRLFHELWRVLKVGGCLLIVDLEGNNEYDQQYSSFSAKTLMPLLANTGFAEIKVSETLVWSKGYDGGGFESSRPSRSREFEGISARKMTNYPTAPWQADIENEYLKRERNGMMNLRRARGF